MTVNIVKSIEAELEFKDFNDYSSGGTVKIAILPLKLIMTNTLANIFTKIYLYFDNFEFLDRDDNFYGSGEFEATLYGVITLDSEELLNTINTNEYKDLVDFTNYSVEINEINVNTLSLSYVEPGLEVSYPDVLIAQKHRLTKEFDKELLAGIEVKLSNCHINIQNA